MRSLIFVAFTLCFCVANSHGDGSSTPGNFLYGSMPRSNAASIAAAVALQESDAVRWVNLAAVDVTLYSSAQTKAVFLPAARLTAAYAGYSIHSPIESRRGHDLGTLTAEIWFSRIRQHPEPIRGDRYIGFGFGVLGQPAARIKSSPNFFIGSVEPTLIRRGFRVLLDYTQRHPRGYFSVLPALGVAKVQEPGNQFYLAGSHIMVGGGWFPNRWMKIDFDGYYEIIRLGCLASATLLPTSWMAITGGLTVYGAYGVSADPRLELKFWF